MISPHPQQKRDKLFISCNGTEPFPIEPVFGMFDGFDIGAEER